MKMASGWKLGVIKGIDTSRMMKIQVVTHFSGVAPLLVSVHSHEGVTLVTQALLRYQ
jgi:hypothetical protein